MDEERFDRLARSVGGRGTSRRSVLSGLAGGGLAALGFGARAEGRKRCPRRRRCGKKCCKECFARRVDQITQEPTSYGCCPPKKVCSAPSRPDQCCYPDEVCDPKLPQRDPASLNGICCRRCGQDGQGTPICCQPYEHCVNGRCEPLNSQRLPRRRR